MGKISDHYFVQAVVILVTFSLVTFVIGGSNFPKKLLCHRCSFYYKKQYILYKQQQKQTILVINMLNNNFNLPIQFQKVFSFLFRTKSTLMTWYG